MPYREKKIYSGDILEVEVYPISVWDRKQSRKKKEKMSQPKQKNLNDKNAKKHLIRLINNNFTNNDLSVGLTYSENELPENEAAARMDMTNYIRRIKHYRNKHGLLPLKYIAVIEYGEGKGRIHHHLIISDMDRDIVEQLWGKGRANADRLKADEYGYEALARYITKDPKGNKRWVQSKNLKQPTVKVNDFKYSRRKIEELAKCPEDRQTFESMYPEYILNGCKVSVNEVTAGTYLYIKMRKLKT